MTRTVAILMPGDMGSGVGQALIAQGFRVLSPLAGRSAHTRSLAREAGIEDAKAALDGARQILMERFAEDADLLARLREFLWNESLLVSRVAVGKEQEAAKFADYFEHVASENVGSTSNRIPKSVSATEIILPIKNISNPQALNSDLVQKVTSTNSVCEHGNIWSTHELQKVAGLKITQALLPNWRNILYCTYLLLFL